MSGIPPSGAGRTAVPHALASRTTPRGHPAICRQSEQIGLLVEVQQSRIGGLQPMDLDTRTLGDRSGSDEVEIDVAPEALAECDQQVLATLLHEPAADEQHPRAGA